MGREPDEAALFKQGVILDRPPPGSRASIDGWEEAGRGGVKVGEVGHRVGVRKPNCTWERGTVVKLNRAGICSMYEVRGVHVLLDHNRGATYHDLPMVSAAWGRTGRRYGTGRPARPACGRGTASTPTPAGTRVPSRLLRLRGCV